MPGIQQDVAVVAVHKKEEGIAVVEVDLIVSGKLLQEDDAVEDGDVSPSRFTGTTLRTTSFSGAK